MWWLAAVISATREAEAESLEPRRRKLQRAEIVLLHSTLGDSARLCLKKKKKKKIETILAHMVKPLLY